VYIDFSISYARWARRADVIEAEAKAIVRPSEAGAKIAKAIARAAKATASTADQTTSLRA
jgi:hypothetical protein